MKHERESNQEKWHLSEELTHTAHSKACTEECYGNHSNRPGPHLKPPYSVFCQRGKTNAIPKETRGQHFWKLQHKKTKGPQSN